MKLDTSSYYPAPLLEDDDDEKDAPSPSSSGMMSGLEESDGNTPPGQNDRKSHAGKSKEGGETGPGRLAKGFANFLSWIFVPLLMPVYGAVLAFKLTVLGMVSQSGYMGFVLWIFAINVVLPMLAILFLKRAGIVSDIGLNGRKERTLPYFVCILCLAGTAWFLFTHRAPDWFVMFYVGGTVAGVVEAVVNRWWKISVHAAGIAGIVALVLNLILTQYTLSPAIGWLYASLAVAGVLGSARILLGRHTPAQVLAGYLVGFACVFAAMCIHWRLEAVAAGI